MTRKPAGPQLLVECVRTIAARIGAPAPDEARIGQVVATVVDAHGAIDCADMGIITKDEAASLLLAHMQSELFTLPTSEKEAEQWDDPKLFSAVKRALFGESGEE